ncbi:SOUL heme-binding protein-domain-containing protein [Hyaloraphidium curvatum]|nr:SOUL heme-binding protein-domain-containing protein [Hyaloraphidium curvatum]
MEKAMEGGALPPYDATPPLEARVAALQAQVDALQAERDRFVAKRQAVRRFCRGVFFVLLMWFFVFPAIGRALVWFELGGDYVVPFDDAIAFEDVAVDETTSVAVPAIAVGDQCVDAPMTGDDDAAVDAEDMDREFSILPVFGASEEKKRSFPIHGAPEEDRRPWHHGRHRWMMHAMKKKHGDKPGGPGYPGYPGGPGGPYPGPPGDGQPGGGPPGGKIPKNPKGPPKHVPGVPDKPNKPPKVPPYPGQPQPGKPDHGKKPGLRLQGMVPEVPYEVLVDGDGFEIRKYTNLTLAWTSAPGGSVSKAPNGGFGLLYGYISGKNKDAETGQCLKIPMTAPVFTQEDGDTPGNIVMAFAMPARLARTPEPTDDKVSIRVIPEWTVAAKRVRGWVGDEQVGKAAEELRAAVGEGWKAYEGAKTVLGRFDPPWIPGFMQRNEVYVPVHKA